MELMLLTHLYMNITLSPAWHDSFVFFFGPRNATSWIFWINPYICAIDIVVLDTFRSHDSFIYEWENNYRFLYCNVYMYLCNHICIHICMHTYIHTCTHITMYTYIHTYICMYTPCCYARSGYMTHLYTNETISIPFWICISTCKYLYIYTHIHI